MHNRSVVPPSAVWWQVARPLLWARLRYFRHLVAATVYLPPVRQPAASAHVDRVGLIGSVDAVRVGVTRDELTTLGQVASAVHAPRGRDLVWVHAATPVLTARQAARQSLAYLRDVDAVLIVLGFSDVLLMTAPAVWERNLLQVIHAARAAAGASCRIIITGLAPMDEFRYTARLGRRRIRHQVDRLNATTEAVAERVHGCIYVAPPIFPHTVGRPGDEQYSWVLVHRMWGAAIAASVIDALARDE